MVLAQLRCAVAVQRQQVTTNLTCALLLSGLRLTLAVPMGEPGPLHTQHVGASASAPFDAVASPAARCRFAVFFFRFFFWFTMLLSTSKTAVLFLPFCLAVVKHGALVVNEVYPGYAEMTSPNASVPNAPRYIETMSAGKTMTAGLIGAAITAGLFDLDTPMINYGVTPHANFSRTGVDFFPNLTARHTLAQNTGIGEFPPGTALRYDSDEYIAHLSWLLNRTATDKLNMSAKAWATQRFATPLGIPTLYENQRLDPLQRGDTPDQDPDTEICAGGMAIYYITLSACCELLTCETL